MMKTPWHIWVIGAVSLLWNLGGAYDYLMLHLGIESYRAAMGDELLAWYDGFPLWATTAWALGVWGAVAGSILLLLRTRLAALAFALSLIGILVNTSHIFSSFGARAVDLMGQGGLAFTGAIIVVALLLWLYARMMLRAGVLR